MNLQHRRAEKCDVAYLVVAVLAFWSAGGGARLSGVVGRTHAVAVLHARAGCRQEPRRCPRRRRWWDRGERWAGWCFDKADLEAGIHHRTIRRKAQRRGCHAVGPNHAPVIYAVHGHPVATRFGFEEMDRERHRSCKCDLARLAIAVLAFWSAGRGARSPWVIGRAHAVALLHAPTS